MSLNELAKECIEIAKKNGFSRHQDIDDIHILFPG